MTLPGRKEDPKPEWRLWVTDESKSGCSKQVPVERKRSRAAAGRPAALVSQATNGSEWRSRKSRRWLIHGLSSRPCVDMCACVCVCVNVCVPCRTHSGWQIGKATDGPGSISTAGCCDVSILPSLTTAGQTRAVCVTARTCACLLPSYGECCFKIRTTITLFAKCNKGESLSWWCCCRTVSTANIVNENPGTQQLVFWVFFTVFLLRVCVC